MKRTDILHVSVEPDCNTEYLFPYNPKHVMNTNTQTSEYCFTLCIFSPCLWKTIFFKKKL